MEELAFHTINTFYECEQAIAKKLLADEAILLPDLYSDTFSELAMKHKNKVKNYTLSGACWLLTYLSNALQDSLGIATKHKRYGTLLYQTNGDTLHALSKALGELKSSQKSASSIRKQMDESIYKSHYKLRKLYLQIQLLLFVNTLMELLTVM